MIIVIKTRHVDFAIEGDRIGVNLHNPTTVAWCVGIKKISVRNFIHKLRRPVVIMDTDSGMRVPIPQVSSTVMGIEIGIAEIEILIDI